MPARGKVVRQQSSLDEEAAALRAACEARDRATAELRRQQLNVEEAQAEACRLRTELAEAEAAREHQGKAVDAAATEAAAAAATASAAGVATSDSAGRETEREAEAEECRQQGNRAMREDDLHGALELYTKALEVEGAAPEERLKTLGNRAACFLALGEHSSAATDARAALALSHMSAKNHHRLGCALEAQGQTADALNAFYAARCFNADHPEICSAITRLEVLHPRSPAINEDEAPGSDGVATAREDCERFRLRANAAFKAGRLKEARKLYTRALSRAEEACGPSSCAVADAKARLLANRCLVALALDDFTDALRDAQGAVDAAPGWPKAHFRLGTVLLQKKQHVDAYASFKRASHLDPTNAELNAACRRARAVMLGEAEATEGEATNGEATETPSPPTRSSTPETPVPESSGQGSLVEPKHALEQSDSALKLTIWLPEGAGPSDIDLQLSSSALRLRGVGLTLELLLPRRVRDEAATAAFSKRRGTLTLTMPIEEREGGVLV